MKLAKIKYNVEYDPNAPFEDMRYRATFSGRRGWFYLNEGWGITPREAVKALLRRYNRDRRNSLRWVYREDL